LWTSFLGQVRGKEEEEEEEEEEGASAFAASKWKKRSQRLDFFTSMWVIGMLEKVSITHFNRLTQNYCNHL
jgi:hypothetical protein